MDARFRLQRRAILTAASGALAALAAFALIDRTNWLLGFDSHAYWAVDLAAPYTRYAPEQDAFLYSPPAAILASLFSLLPWEAFREASRALEVGVLVLVAGPLAGPLALTPPATDEWLSGNINLLVAGVVVAGFRWPALWSIPLLTKVTPGIGVLWFAARREWRSFGIAVGTTAAIAAATFVVVPNLWFAWVHLLVTQPADPVGVPLLLAFPVRLAMSAALILVGARLDRRWVVPFAVVFAHAHLWLGTLAILVALVPLVRQQRDLARPAVPALDRQLARPSWRHGAITG